MSKTQQIRDVLAGGKLPLSKLLEKTGLMSRKGTEDLCYYLQTCGEVKIDRSGEEPVIQLTGRRAPPPKRAGAKGKKPAGRKAKPVKRRKAAGYRRIAFKFTKAVRNGHDLNTLTVENFRAAGEGLAAAVRTQVDGVDDNPALAAALANLERAGKIYDAARKA